MKRIIQALVLIGGLSSTSGAIVHQVNIFDFGYNPSNVTVTQGDTVRWTNTGPSTHTSTSNSGSLDPWNSGLLSASQSYQRQFNVVGNFGYHCTPHPFMTGTITVEQATDVGSRDNPVLPSTFQLRQNYPNPFNASTVISYVMPVAGEVTVTIYNMLGQLVKRFEQGKQNPGEHVIIWDGTNTAGNAVSTGIYFYKLEAGVLNQVCKMTFIK